MLIGVLMMGCSCSENPERRKKNIDDTHAADSDDWHIDTSAPAIVDEETDLDSGSNSSKNNKIVVEAIFQNWDFDKIENCWRVNQVDDIDEWSADGTYVAYTTGTGKFYLADMSKYKVLYMPRLDIDMPFCARASDLRCMGILDLRVAYNSLYFTTLSFPNKQHMREMFVKYDITNHTYHIINDVTVTLDDDIDADYHYYHFITDDRYVVAIDGCGKDAMNPVWCLIDLQTMQKQQLSKHGGHPSITDGHVVWIDGDLQTDVKYLDIKNNIRIDVTNDDFFQLVPHTDGQRIVYNDLQFGSGDPDGPWDHAVVMLYDIASQETRQLTDQRWISSMPKIANGRATWLDYRNAPNPNYKGSITGVTIRELDLESNVEVVIAKLPEFWKQDYIYMGDTLVIHAGRYETDDLLYCPIIRD
jgi:hypothetical protein